jgi:hypothetical protein
MTHPKKRWWILVVLDPWAGGELPLDNGKIGFGANAATVLTLKGLA